MANGTHRGSVEPFMRSGTMHIFAISGLPSRCRGIFVALLRAVTLPRIACGLIVIPIIWFYTAATGWQASAIRSSVDVGDHLRLGAKRLTD
jgi:predicted membrane metal-binding protein